jgi:hypothetical protein
MDAKTGEERIGSPVSGASIERVERALEQGSTEVRGADPAVTLEFRRSLKQASEIVSQWPEWKRNVFGGVARSSRASGSDA